MAMTSMQQPNREALKCLRRAEELAYCGRYFDDLERREREARERERRQWLEALTHGWRRPF